MASRSAKRRSASPSASYGWPEDAKFLVPDGVREHFRAGIGQRGHELRADWLARFEAYRTEYPDLADELERDADGASFRRAGMPTCRSSPPTPRALPRRDSSGKVLNAIAPHYPWLIGGAADLAPSTKTRLTFEGAGDFEAGNYGGRNLHFGIREHAMGAILNGLALSKIRGLRLELPDLLRLYEAAHPLERADGAAGHLHLHARFDRPRARTAQRISRSSSSSRCAPFPASSRCGLPTPTRSSRHGASSSG